VFARGLDGATWHRWWDGHAWGGWESLGGDFNFAPISMAWAANRLDLFGVGTDNVSYHKYWNGSAWGPSITTWEAQGGIFEAFPQR
jgi:hypothetical protein